MPIKQKGKNAGLEWVGGISSLPVTITEEGEHFVPEVLVWMEGELVLGSEVTPPGEALSLACESLRGTMSRPLAGEPRRPSRVRVESAELAEVLRAGYPDLDVVVGATPVFDEMFADMADQMAEPDNKPYVLPNVDDDALTSFFQAGAALYGSEPWKTLPKDGALFAMSIPQLGVSEAIVSMISQGEEAVGVTLFSNVDSFASFVNAGDFSAGDVPHDGMIPCDSDSPEPPSHIAFAFEHESEILPAVLDDIAKHGLEVAGPGAYPEVMSVDQTFVLRPSTAQEVLIAAVAARGLAQMMAAGNALRAAWEGDEPISGIFSVSTPQGPIEISLSTPFMPDIDIPADTCLMLDDETTKELEEALTSPGAFDAAKTIAELGRAKGYDVDSPEGLEEWMRALNDGVPQGEMSAPAKKNVSKVQNAKRKSKRKATRKARRKKR